MSGKANRRANRIGPSERAVWIPENRTSVVRAIAPPNSPHTTMIQSTARSACRRPETPWFRSKRVRSGTANALRRLTHAQGKRGKQPPAQGGQAPVERRRNPSGEQHRRHWVQRMENAVERHPARLEHEQADRGQDHSSEVEGASNPLREANPVRAAPSAGGRQRRRIRDHVLSLSSRVDSGDDARQNLGLAVGNQRARPGRRRQQDGLAETEPRLGPLMTDLRRPLQAHQDGEPVGLAHGRGLRQPPAMEREVPAADEPLADDASGDGLAPRASSESTGPRAKSVDSRAWSMCSARGLPSAPSASPVEDPERGVGHLLDLGQQHPRADRVDRSRLDQEAVARPGLEPMEQRLDLARPRSADSSSCPRSTPGFRPA